ncbi:hypothetical protein FNF31_05298 [Cafeteria roenbergensis]|uniref:Exportin-1/Importin-beta-like domain-containing protein n=1 Tax=Cafeteria roenbergensis TaxID=33653 RepID=A0A5A8D411_CAFRO|nr:hypothetical protein FNF31_05298 [Cafeteria roenbergensis]
MTSGVAAALVFRQERLGSGAMAAAAAGGAADPIAGKPVSELTSLFGQAVPVALGEARIRASTESAKAAETFLNRLQRSSEAWAVMTHVLEATAITEQGDASLYLAEAARVLASKVRHDMLGLAESSHASLRAMLLKHLLRTSGQAAARPAFRHLAVALAAAAVTMPSWTSVVPSLVAACGGPARLGSPEGTCEALALLTVLLELPTEVTRRETCISESRRSAVRTEITRGAEAVHSTLDAILASHSANVEIRSLCLKAFSAWVEERIMPVAVLPGSRLTSALLSGLKVEATFAHSSQLLVALLEHVDRDGTADDKTSVAGTVLPSIIDAEPLLRSLIPLCIDDETDDRAITLAAAAASAGCIAAHSLVGSTSALAPLRPGLTRMMAVAAASGCRPVQMEALRFWHALFRAAVSARSRSEPLPADLFASASGLLPCLVAASELPADDFDSTPVDLGAEPAAAAAAAAAHQDAIARPEITQAEANEIETRVGTTKVMGDWVNVCVDEVCRLQGSGAVVRELVGMTGTALSAARAVPPAAAGGRAPAEVRRLEAALTVTGFAVCGVFADTELPMLDALLSALHTIPSYADVHLSALSLVRKAAPWIAPRDQLFAPVSRFVEAHLRLPGPCATGACRALVGLTRACPDHCRASSLPTALVNSVMKLPDSPAADALYQLGHLVATSRSETALSGGIAALLRPLVAAVETIAADPTSGIRAAFSWRSEGIQLRGRRPPSDAEAVRRIGVDGVAAAIGCIGPLISGLASAKGSMLGPEHLRPTVAALWPAMSSLLEMGKSEESIAVAVCACHNAILGAFPELYRGRVASLARDLAQKHEETKFSCFMYSGSRLIAEFGLASAAPVKAALAEMVTRMATEAFAALAVSGTVEPFNRNPILVDELFCLITSMAKHLPDELLGWSLLDDALRCAYAGLFSSRQVAQSAVLLFIQTVIRIGAPFLDDSELLAVRDVSLAERMRNASRRLPAVKASIGRYGAAIVKRLIAGAAGSMHKHSITSSAGSISSVIMAMRDLLKVGAFRPFFKEQLDAAVPDSVMHPEEKAKVLENVCFRGVGPSRSFEFDKVDRALLDIHQRCMSAFRAGRFDIPE